MVREQGIVLSKVIFFGFLRFGRLNSLLYVQIGLAAEDYRGDLVALVGLPITGRSTARMFEY